ncbi:MAG: hypothetical protein MR031_05110 [Tenericutes bacterium]|nr:hypothetical protein [Mycoplasmatota bacterium]
MNESNILLYETDEGKINVDVILKDELNKLNDLTNLFLDVAESETKE